MISINTNYGGLFASKAASQSQRTLDTAMERLSSGLRINYAKDDAAGQAISTRLTAEVEGLQMASRNAADAQSLIDTAEGALQESHNLLLRMRELAVQSANGTMASSDRAALDAEVGQLILEVERIAQTTSWAGNSLINGNGSTDGDKSYVFQLGVNGASSDRITVEINDARAVALGLVTDKATGSSSASLDNDNDYTATGADADTRAVSIANQSDAQSAIGTIDLAIKAISESRAELGAVSNRLTSTINNLNQISVNLGASKGRIMDADFAAETSNLAKGQILQQAATAMLAQANASKQNVLALVR
jgi:flagellin